MKKEAFQYEFGGPMGTFINIWALPVLVWCLIHWSHEGTVWHWPFYDLSLSSTSSSFRSFFQSNRFTSATCIVVAWFLFQVALERCLPCQLVQGTPVVGVGAVGKGDGRPESKQGRPLTYRINGHLAFWVTGLVLQIGYPYWNETHQIWQFQNNTTLGSLAQLYDITAELAAATMVFCFLLSVYLYVRSFRSGSGHADRHGHGDEHAAVVLATPGMSGNAIYDFWMGRELNPRWGTFDWKEFCELRPGLIGWMLLNIACMQKQQQVQGYISGSMMLLNAFQGLYIWDALYQEQAILTTMDITTDGFGYMLVFGDLAWVPFTYSIQARYLVYHDPNLSASSLAAILALHVLGYIIFRGANGQKDAFRKGKLPHLNFLQTRRGTKLLTAGWWGTARKINYTGDWIMGLTWCLVCGFDSIVPYYYAIYFMVLLIHRSIRDDHLCQQKYGADWDLYKQMVPYRFIPGIV